MDVVVIGVIEAIVTSMGIWFLQRSISKRDQVAQEREWERQCIKGIRYVAGDLRCYDHV